MIDPGDDHADGILAMKVRTLKLRCIVLCNWHNVAWSAHRVTSATLSPPHHASYQGIQLDPSVKAVVVGLDPRLTYRFTMFCSFPRYCVVKASSCDACCSKLAIATAYLARENVEFIACNTDSTFPAMPGLKLPGAGRSSSNPHHVILCESNCLVSV